MNALDEVWSDLGCSDSGALVHALRLSAPESGKIEGQHEKVRWARTERGFLTVREAKPQKDHAAQTCWSTFWRKVLGSVCFLFFLIMLHRNKEENMTGRSTSRYGGEQQRKLKI